jgi:hypothetical protein
MKFRRSVSSRDRIVIQKFIEELQLPFGSEPNGLRASVAFLPVFVHMLLIRFVTQIHYRDTGPSLVNAAGAKVARASFSSTARLWMGTFSPSWPGTG